MKGHCKWRGRVIYEPKRDIQQKVMVKNRRPCDLLSLFVTENMRRNQFQPINARYVVIAIQTVIKVVIEA